MGSKEIAIGVGCFIVLAAIAITLPSPEITGTTIKDIDSVNLDDFAKCLTQNNVKMYGASWCPHCQNQKTMFGSSWQYISYVECDDNGQPAQVCTNEGVQGYPTWDFNGKKVPGEQDLTSLSKNSGCSLELII